LLFPLAEPVTTPFLWLAVEKVATTTLPSLIVVSSIARSIFIREENATCGQGRILCRGNCSQFLPAISINPWKADNCIFTSTKDLSLRAIEGDPISLVVVFLDYVEQLPSIMTI
jgi:hypothetical protein